MTPEQQAIIERALARANAAPAGAVAATPAPAAPAAFERAGGYGAADAGVADAVIRGAIGVKDLAGAVVPAYGRHRVESGGKALDEAVLREQEAEYEADPEKMSRVWGNIVGNVGGTMATGLGAAGAATGRAIQAALPGLMKYLGIPISAATVSAVQSAILTPGTPEEKAEAAKTDAMFGAGLAVGGTGLKKAATGMFKPTAEASSLMAQGVTPTLQQGAESPIARFIGGLTSGATNPRTRQNEEIINSLLQRVAPGVDTSGMNIPERVALLTQRFNQEYDTILGGKQYALTQPARSQIWGAARGGRGTQPEATELATRAMSGTGVAMQSRNTVPMGTDKMKEYRQLMQDAIDDFNASGGVMERQAKNNLIRARQVYDRLVRDPSLSAQERATLADLDERYGDFRKFAAAAEKGSFHAKPTASAVMREFEGTPGFSSARNPVQRDLLEPAVRTMNLMPQDEARTVLSATKRILAGGAKLAAGGAVGAGSLTGNPLALALAPAYGISLLGQSRGGARHLFGEQEWQKVLARKIREASPYALGSGQTFTGED